MVRPVDTPERPSLSDDAFSPIPRARASDQVAEEVRRRIFRGALQPGQKLPGERDLAAQFGVNRSTVREALTALSQLGLVAIRHGGGAVIRDFATEAGLQLLPHMFGRDADPALLVSLLEARRAFVVKVTELAASRATAAERRSLRAVVDEMERASADPRRVQELDVEFHHRLASASRNWVFLLILNSVRPVYLMRRQLFEPLYRRPDQIVAAYRRVVGAMGKRDGRGAARAMDDVMDLGERSVRALARR